MENTAPIGDRGERRESDRFERERASQVLIDAIRKLAGARTISAISYVVRHAARMLVQADGATFVLRDQEQCFYLDEEAISPLWKGQRFPLGACISGWAMQHQQQVMISDIFADARIPHDAYRPTFVKSLVMTPVRRDPARAAIGTYWAHQREASPSERAFLQDLADATAVALESAEIYAQLEDKVQQRTEELKALNRELEAFSYTVAHDLRSPLTGIIGFAEVVETLYAPALDEKGLGMLHEIANAGMRMNNLITDLLDFARCTGAPLNRSQVNLSHMAQVICARLMKTHPERKVQLSIQPEVLVQADERLMGVVLENLLNNAFKYSRNREVAEISLGTQQAGEEQVVFVRDNGAGFDAALAADLFAPFRRQHTSAQFEGTGVGLATVARIVRRHGGQIRAESTADHGATFLFTLPDPVLAAPG
jgi:signal transduction histidine kinase